MAFAARLASKRKAEEGGSDAGDDVESEERGLGRGGMSSLMQSDRDETIRNPFADDEDDEDSDEGSDDGDLGAGAEGASGSEGNSSWNRGGWWRGALGRKKRPSVSNETFGDGRDSSSGEDDDVGAGEEGGEGANSSEDEEFGDFAMPEQASGSGSGIDAEREKILVKPLPLHPGAGGGTGSGNKGLMGLWPFTKKDRESSPKEGEAAEEEKAEGAGIGEKVPAEEGEAAAAAEDEKKGAADEPPVVLSEDGEKVQAAVEAKRRTSIEEPDEGEDEVVV